MPPLLRGAGGIGTPLIKGGRGDRHPPYQGGQGGSAPPLSRGAGGIGTPLIKAGLRGEGGIYLQFNSNQLLIARSIWVYKACKSPELSKTISAKAIFSAKGI